MVGTATKWTGACDKRLARLISNIHNTSDYKQYCHVGNTAHHCRWGLFQDSDFAGDLEDSKLTLGEIPCIFTHGGSSRSSSLGFGCYILPQIKPEHGATSCAINIVKSIPTQEHRKSLTRRKILVGQMLIMSLQTQNFLPAMPCFIFLRIMK